MSVLPDRSRPPLMSVNSLPARFAWEAQASDVVVRSPLRDPDSNRQIANVVAAFNARSLAAYGDLDATVTTSWLRGKRIAPNNLLFVHRNQTPVAVDDHQHLVARTLNPSPGVTIELIGERARNSPHIVEFGSHIINVPAGQYCKIALGSSRRPLLLDEGPHVIHDSTLAMSDFVDKSTDYIQCGGVVHVLRVPPGQLAKVWIGTQAILLEHRPSEYIVDNPLFRLDSIVPQDAPLVSHGNLHRVRVPRGKIGCIWVNNTPRMLTAQEGAFEFDTPYFRTEQAWLRDAYDKLIVHGSIKRILPSTGEVCVAYRAGTLIILKPEQQQAYLIDDETFQVDGFLSTIINTVVFPSEQTKEARRKENPRATNEDVNFEVYTTRDSLKIGVKLLIVYRVVDPEQTLRQLRRADIVSHIENLASVDASKAMQQSSSQDFLQFTSTRARVSDSITTDLLDGKAEAAGAAPLLHFTDIVRNALASDLARYGVELVRLNIESPKVVDVNIQSELEKTSLLSAKSNAEASMLQQQLLIARTRAEQEAKVSSIAIEQANRNKVTSAQADLDSARLRAAAQVEEEKGRQLAADLRGKQFDASPVLLQLELARMQTEAVTRANISLVITPEQMAGGLGALLMPQLTMARRPA